ncbi:MAG: HigA family addiction module antitoxin [Parasphingopyxis sp.]|uniref:HigA family addiction module antitoxin n=1 Tax=Parasphingopyxis sp. TaxID=1920299 RepID=UPI0032ED2944
MSNSMLAGLQPMHPGEFLRETVLPGLDESMTGIASALGLSRQSLYQIVNEKRPVTPRVALRLAKAFGNSAEFWLDMQARYDLAIEREEDAEGLARVRALAA